VPPAHVIAAAVPPDRTNCRCSYTTRIQLFHLLLEAASDIYQASWHNTNGPQKRAYLSPGLETPLPYHSGYLKHISYHSYKYIFSCWTRNVFSQNKYFNLLNFSLEHLSFCFITQYFTLSLSNPKLFVGKLSYSVLVISNLPQGHK
jgi:hypothetical protein